MNITCSTQIYSCQTLFSPYLTLPITYTSFSMVMRTTIYIFHLHIATATGHHSLPSFNHTSVNAIQPRSLCTFEPQYCLQLKSETLNV